MESNHQCPKAAALQAACTTRCPSGERPILMSEPSRTPGRHRQVSPQTAVERMSIREGLNLRHPPYQGGALTD